MNEKEANSLLWWDGVMDCTSPIKVDVDQDVSDTVLKSFHKYFSYYGKIADAFGISKTEQFIKFEYLYKTACDIWVSIVNNCDCVDEQIGHFLDGICAYAYTKIGSSQAIHIVEPPYKKV